ncbi:MAG: pitrilysin family protein [Syntrophales bacterium]
MKRAHRRISEISVVILVILIHAAFLISLLPAAWASAEERTGDENILRATLENGLRVVIVRNTQAPVVTTIVNYLVGSKEAPAGFPGMAHAQEHMMFRGSPGLTADQLADIIALMGGDFNAETQQTVTQYFFTCAREDMDLALHIESIRMKGVLDAEESWKKERGAIEQEVAQDISDPDYIFYAKLIEIMFNDTPYAHTPLGTVPSFEKTTGAMLKTFYDTWYAPNNAILVIVGHVEPREALKEVEKYFSPIPRKNVPQRPEVRLGPLKPKSFTMTTDQSHGLAAISFRMPGYGSGDYAASEVLADVLSSQRGNLFELVVQGKALAIDFSLLTLPHAGLGYAAASFPKGTDPQPLIKEVRRILADDVKKGFSADLVEAAKRNRLTKAELQKNSVPGLAMAWSQALAVEGRQSPDDTLSAIQKVSVADVNRVAVKYLQLHQSVEAILVPEAAGKPVSAKPRGGMESFAPKETKSVELPVWAEKALKRLSVPASTVNPEVVVLPNGLKLIIQYASVSDTASIYGHVKNNPYLQTPEGKEGLDRVLGPLFSFGTASMDRLAFQKAQDDIGAEISVDTDFSLQALAKHFDRGLELLADNLLHPALPAEAFKTLRKQVGDEVAGELESPDYLTKRTLKTSLFPNNDAVLREATPSTISSLTLDEVKSYYQKVFRPDLTTIVFIGKVPPDAVRKAIGKYFGSWKVEGPKPSTLLPPVPPNKPSATAVPDLSRSQTKVILAGTLGLTRSHPDYYALELGNHVLGGAFYSTWLYRDLREKTGLVYHVSSSFDIGQTRSLYEVRYSCDPDNVSKARAIIEHDLTKMQEKPVTPDELSKAQSLVLREIQLAEASADGIALGLIYRATHDLPLDEPVIAARRFLQLTPQDVQAAFSKWLRVGDIVQVTQGPFPR